MTLVEETPTASQEWRQKERKYLKGIENEAKLKGVKLNFERVERNVVMARTTNFIGQLTRRTKKTKITTRGSFTTKRSGTTSMKNYRKFFDELMRIRQSRW